MGNKKKKILIILVVVAVLLPAVLLALPPVAAYGAETLLARQGVQAQINDVDLNLFTGILKVRQASGRTASGEGFRLDHGLVHLRYLPLFKKRLHITRLELSGTRLDVVRDEAGKLAVAGIALAASEGETQTSAWGFGLDQARVENTAVHYQDARLDQTLVVNASSVSGVASWAPGQPIGFNAAGELLDGKLTLEGQIQPFGETITADMHVKAGQLPLEIVTPYAQQDLGGKLDAELDFKMHYQASVGLEFVVQGESSVSSLSASFPEQALDVGVDKVDVKGRVNVGLRADDSQEKHLEGKAELKAGGLKVVDVASGTGQLLVTADVFEAKGMEMNTLDDIRMNSFAATGIQALKDSSGTLVSAARVNLASPSLAELKNLHIAETTLAGVDGHLKRSSEGKWNYESWFEAREAVHGESAGNQAQVKPDTPSGSESFIIRIDTVQVGNGSRLSVSDATVEPQFNSELNEVQASLQELDSSQPDQASPLSIEANVGRYGRLEMSGSVRPFAEPVTANLSGNLSGMDLVPVSGYTRNILGHKVARGTVSSDINIHIAEGNMDAVFDLVLNKLKVAATRGGSGKFEAQTGMPLSGALALMQDRDDNVRIKLPITGDLARPDVNIDGIIQNALFKAIQKAVLAFYSPLGVVMAADKLVQFATALRFEPVEFQPGSVLLGNQQASYLDNMAQLVSSRPGIQLSVCGYATSRDQEEVAEKVAEDSAFFFGLFKPEVDSSEVPDEAMQELAHKRAVIVGDYLVARGVGKEQVILCAPAVESDGSAQPRVEVSI